MHRYKLGKRPFKYFKEDVWPNCVTTLPKLNIDESKALEIFYIFAKIDKDESESLDILECMNYFESGKKTRFTERIFDCGNRQPGSGLNYLEFATIMWNFCSLTASLMSRFVFEILDVDNQSYLEKPDIETIYRMIYARDVVDENITNTFKLDTEGRKSKQTFINSVLKSKNIIIKPALAYQNRLRKAMGGSMMWDSITTYRKRHFSIYDLDAKTLEESFITILAAEDPNKVQQKMHADGILEMERENLKLLTESTLKRIQDIETVKGYEKRKSNMKFEDRNMNLSWMSFEAKRMEFEGMHFTPDNVWERTERRTQLYKSFDKAVFATNTCWAEKNRKEIIATEGSPEDRRARSVDFLATTKGKIEKEKIVLFHIMALIKNRLIPENEEHENEQITEVLIRIEEELIKLSVINNTGEEAILAGARNIASQYGKWSYYRQVEEQSVTDFDKRAMDITIMEITARQNSETNTRNFEIKQKELELWSTFGSKITRWELVHDMENDAFVYINVDTLQTIPEDVAICETCDAFIEQMDKKCFKCNTIRSKKNLLHYKPIKK